MICFNVFVPEKNAVIHMEEGSGDRLTREDRQEGYVDYIDYSVYDLDYMGEESDGGIEMFKELASERYKEPEECISDILKAVYGKAPEYLILEKDSSHLSILNIVDEEENTPILVKYRGEKPDAKDRFLAAVQYAEEDGYRGDYLSIPEYLKKAGLTVIPTTVHTIHNTSFGPKKEYEKAGFKPAQCIDCDSYDDGYCCHYGGRVSGKQRGCDHCHSASIYRLLYDDLFAGMISAVPKPGKRYTPQDVAKLLNDEDFPKIKELFTLFGKEIDMEQWELLSRKYVRDETVKIIE